ncbi:hypothetical protein BDV29DRAFT_200290 [Aspergillus leporis]|uniref:Mid2 domain-containing protein n=1 Tax=Aspergillus leporis TaxID=41062 RepID=A0A5N5WII9_9EURO|nr:hypothetical protein BDV29DRAFT_200290 [Aspergillus leporis]
MTTTTPAPTTKTRNPTLSPEWTPSAYGCRGKDDFWIWDFHDARDQRTVLGGPSQTTNCFPSTWNPSGMYDGTKCPRGFTSACQASGSPSSVTTCCPTVYSFSCVANPTKAPHGPWFPCMSQYDTSLKRTITRTDFAANTITFGEVTQRTNLHLFALGVAFATPTATDSSDPGRTRSSDSSETGSSGHSTITAGAAAGIGVGSAAGVIFITLLAWFLFRRKLSSGMVPQPNTEHAAGVVGESKTMHAQPQLQELDGRAPRELPG